jgi:hypothetical protein
MLRQPRGQSRFKERSLALSDPKSLSLNTMSLESSLVCRGSESFSYRQFTATLRARREVIEADEIQSLVNRFWRELS